MSKKKNQGFSLIEMVVVIAIMAVAMGIVSYSYGAVRRYQAEACAQGIKSSLELCRVASMAYGGGSLTVSKDATTGEVMVSKNGGTAEKVGKSTVTVTFKRKSGATVYTLGDAATPNFQVEFSSSGSIKDTDPIEWIRVSGNKNYKITLYKLTGKATMESE